MNLRTSISHPLAIADLRVAPDMGRIGITFCPGKCQSNALTGVWKRDLALDLDAIADWGAAAVVTLIEDHELEALNVPGIGKAVADRHMLWFHLPILDVAIPDRAFEARWLEAGKTLRSMIRNGFDVLIHCKGGLGRAGTIAARLLVELGWRPDEAVAGVRHVRPGAIETIAQEDHVHACHAVSEDAPERSSSAVTDRGLGALLGLAVGDALGTTVEFRKRDSFPRLATIIGGGPFGLRPGEWTDDTAMALALADSLIALEGLDERDLMSRFVAWWRRGRYSCTGECFDIGITTRDALSRFEQSGNPIAGSTSSRSAGNGSLMRLAPVVLSYVSDGVDATVDAARRQSATTHGAEACIEACDHFSRLLYQAITGELPSALLRPAGEQSNADVSAVMEGSWRGKHRRDVRSSGYVIHSLEAALWCVGRTGSFRDAVVLAANLGDDADTTAAITGQLAGAIYGLEGIPPEWLTTLAWAERIEQIGRRLLSGD
ncbi:hypothetical protein DF286_12115 [Sphingosinicella humi]|uniref:Tyrosine specific protein phosphatases domain-containing protein n=2 Tax=Allosphingosinicella humi TaxID=2068657 RepID=A0A2U2J5B8_9SPHN|nr:hypothetical protein DF286_12115 [Sphingosinicella humi]